MVLKIHSEGRLRGTQLGRKVQLLFREHKIHGNLRRMNVNLNEKLGTVTPHSPEQ